MLVSFLHEGIMASCEYLLHKTCRNFPFFFFFALRLLFLCPNCMNQGHTIQNSLVEVRKTDTNMHTAQSHHLYFLKKGDSKYCPDRYDRLTLGPTSELGQKL